MINGILDKDGVRRNIECVQKQRDFLTLSAKYVAFAARRDPPRTTKNILEMTIAGKVQRVKVQILVLQEVGHAMWSKDGEKRRSSSASLSTPRRSVKEKGRSKSPTGSSPSKITQENKTLKQEVEEAKRNLACKT